MHEPVQPPPQKERSLSRKIADADNAMTRFIGSPKNIPYLIAGVVGFAVVLWLLGEVIDGLKAFTGGGPLFGMILLIISVIAVVLLLASVEPLFEELKRSRERQHIKTLTEMQFSEGAKARAEATVLQSTGTLDADLKRRKEEYAYKLKRDEVRTSEGAEARARAKVLEETALLDVYLAKKRVDNLQELLLKDRDVYVAITTFGMELVKRYEVNDKATANEILDELAKINGAYQAMQNHYVVDPKTGERTLPPEMEEFVLQQSQLLNRFARRVVDTYGSGEKK